MNHFELGVILAVIISLGIFGNILSLIVLLLGKRCRKLFCSSYLITLAISDTVTLALPALELCLYLLTSTILRNLNQFMCKLLTFLLYYGTHVSSWTVVGVSVARAISIWFPFRSQTWRHKTAIPYLVTILSILFIVDLPFIIDSDFISIRLDSSIFSNLSDILRDLNITDLGNNPSVNDTSLGNNNVDNSEMTAILDNHLPNATKANTSDKLDEIANTLANGDDIANTPSNWEDIANTLDNLNDIEIGLCLVKGDSIYAKGNALVPIILVLVLSFALPCFIIMFSNSMIIFKLLQRVRTFNKNSPCRGNIQQSRMTSLTLRILILGVVHSISTGPVATAELMKAISVDSEVMFLNQTTLYRFFNLLFYLNSGVNFILYCLFGNEFRQDLYNILRISKS